MVWEEPLARWKSTVSSDGRSPDAEIAVLIPCFNEAVTVSEVVTSFREALPDATVYVYDNNSSDETVSVAQAAGAVVRSEARQGKGWVVRRMFADIDADLYLLVDGDATYNAGDAQDMLQALQSKELDMVVAKRTPVTSAEAFRRGHVMGNKLFGWLLGVLFQLQLSDVFSGYRILTRRLVKSFPAQSSGFEIEAELTAHAAEVGAPVGEIESQYLRRPDGSDSKLRTIRDGFVILWSTVRFYRAMRPIRFFGFLSLLLAVAGFVVGSRVIADYVQTGLVPRVPSAILAAALIMIAGVSVVAGLVLDSVAMLRRENRILAYLDGFKWSGTAARDQS